MKINGSVIFLMIFFGMLSCRAMHVQEHPHKPGKLSVQTPPQRLKAVIKDLDQALNESEKGKRVELRKKMDAFFFEPQLLVRAQSEPAQLPSALKKASSPKQALATSRHAYFADDERRN
jgi:hypothetical protein